MRRIVWYAAVLVGMAAFAGVGLGDPPSARATDGTAVCPAASKGQARCFARVAGLPSARTAGPSATIWDLSPLRLSTAYNVPNNGTGTVAIVDAFSDPNIESELAVFDNAFGLPACTVPNGCLTVLNQNGATSPLPRSDPNWQLEIALDVQTVHALCTGCHIVLVETNSNNWTDLLAGDETAAARASTVSNSWGNNEWPTETGYDSHFTNHPGVRFLYSSGDYGFADGAQYPAASPYVTAVGGTSLIVNGSGWARLSEAAWGGAGSGCSAYEAKPGWQHDTGCPNRMVSDLSADADVNTGVAIYVAGRWWQMGGTSLSAPIIAALYHAQLQDSSWGAWAYFHYGALFDVRSGNNGSCSPAYFCQGTTGYDGPTGVGAPNGLQTLTFTNFAPTSGAVGQSVVIGGGGFTGATSVTFNGTSAGFRVMSDGEIDTSVPAGATAGRITVQGPLGTATSAASFTVIQPPTITSVTPSMALPGSTVTITGTNLGWVSEVLFHWHAASFTVVSGTTITATVPLDADDGTIFVRNVAGGGSSPATFYVLETPSIDSITPFGPAGSTVTITGSSFVGTTAVAFNGTTAGFFVNSDTQITATAPASGVITVTNPAGTGSSPSNFTVIVAPAVTSFAPDRGFVGSTVTITGTSFYAGLGATTSVRFGTAAASFTVVSDTEIHAVVPVSSSVRVITVANAAGEGSSSTGFSVNRTPSIRSLLPVAGALSSVLIDGNGLTGATSVTFNGIAATFTVRSDERILATVPPGMTSGTVTVTTPGGTASKTTSFPVPVGPTITSLSPSSGAQLAAVTITGTGFTGTTSVAVNGATARYSLLSDAKIVVVVPLGARSGPITVTNPAGTATSAPFTVIR